MSSATMRAIQYRKFGSPEVLTYEVVPRPEVAEGQVLIRVHAVGTNPAEWRSRAGFPDVPEEYRYAIPRISWPSIPGFDVSGVIEEVGLGVTSFREGDAVFGMVGFPEGGRGYAEYTVAPVKDLALKPAGINHVHAAALPMAGLTAMQLVVPDLAAGQKVLINGAAGGVGHIAVQLAKHKGAQVIAVASGRNADFLRELGIDEFIDYTTASVETMVHDVDLIVDMVGGKTGDSLIAVLRRGGRFIPVNIGPSPERAAEAGVILGTSHRQRLHSDNAQLAEIGRLVESGHLRVVVEKVFPLAEARQAHEYVEHHHLRGKMVLLVRE